MLAYPRDDERFGTGEGVVTDGFRTERFRTREAFGTNEAFGAGGRFRAAGFCTSCG
jgi:hypothetical protein